MSELLRTAHCSTASLVSASNNNTNRPYRTASTQCTWRDADALGSHLLDSVANAFIERQLLGSVAIAIQRGNALSMLSGLTRTTTAQAKGCNSRGGETDE